MRNRIARPIVGVLDGWIATKLEKTLVGSAVYKALKQARNRWLSIKTYLTVGNITIDNNTMERSIRPIALGRKNWLFAGSVKARQYMAGIMSLIATVKANGLDPAAWLLDTLKKLPT